MLAALLAEEGEKAVAAHTGAASPASGTTEKDVAGVGDKTASETKATPKLVGKDK